MVFVLVVVPFLGMEVITDDAVGPVPNRDGHAEVAALTVKGRAQRAARIVAEAVLEDALDGFVLVVFLGLLLFVVVLLFFLVGGTDGGIAGNGKVVVFARVAIDVPRPLAAATIQTEAAVSGIRAGVAADEQTARQWLLRHLRGNPVGVDIYRTPHGARAVEQGAGTLDDLDPVGEERFHRDAVVRTGGRCVHGRHVVLHHEYPGSAHAVDDRLPHGGTKGCGMHTRALREGFADGQPRRVFEFLAGENRRRLRHFSAEWMAVDHDLFNAVAVTRSRVVLRVVRFGLGRHRCGGDGRQ